MKTRGLFLSALMMGAIFVGCSNEEEVLNNAPETKANAGDNYIAVNIVAPNDVISRGVEGDFQAGSDEENAVSSAMFVFYNANGGVVDAVSAELKWTSGAGSVEKISNAMVILSDPPTWPTQVVALLNAPFTELQLESMSLSQLMASQGNYSSTSAFVMTNSVYKNGENIVTTTALTDANICKDEDTAEKNPVSIPVERVLAKVEASKSVNFNIIAPDVQPKLDGKDVNFVPTITGMALVHTNPVSYLFKNIDGVTGWEGWNDPSNWRSYWANSAVPANNGYKSLSWNTIADSSEDAYSGYCHENTSSTATKLLVTAQFKAEDAEKFETVIKYNGTYFTEDGLKDYLSSQYFSEITHGTDKSNEWRNHMTFVSAGTDNEWEVKLALVADGETAVPTPNGEITLESVLTKINSKTMSQWTDGKCYYYVNVEHFGPENSSYEIGVVRNHWYKLTLNSIKGLGTPVFDPSKEITPDKPEEENYFVAAEVKILKWKLVTQNVDLQ